MAKWSLAIALVACNSSHTRTPDAGWAGPCTGDPALGTWLAIDNAGTTNASPYLELEPDCTYQPYSASSTWRFWKRLDPQHLEWLDAQLRPLATIYIDGNLAEFGVRLSGTKPAPPYDAAGTTWFTSYYGGTANGMPYYYGVTVALAADGTATEDDKPTSMFGPLPYHFDGTWTQEPFGVDLSLGNVSGSYYWLGTDLGLVFQHQ